MLIVFLIFSFDAKITSKQKLKVLLFRSTHPTAETALEFGIHKSMVNKWLLKKDELMLLEPSTIKHGCARKPLYPAWLRDS